MCHKREIKSRHGCRGLEIFVSSATVALYSRVADDKVRFPARFLLIACAAHMPTDVAQLNSARMLRQRPRGVCCLTFLVYHILALLFAGARWTRWIGCGVYSNLITRTRTRFLDSLLNR